MIAIPPYSCGDRSMILAKSRFERKCFFIARIAIAGAIAILREEAEPPCGAAGYLSPRRRPEGDLQPANPVTFLRRLQTLLHLTG
jgi:hypothetical protein